MRFLIAGAGAIGGYIGACMARAGQDVTLFARGPHLRAMQERGSACPQRGRRFRSCARASSATWAKPAPSMSSSSA